MGVGVELTMEHDEPVVARVMAGGAAEKAGVVAGDHLIAVDGQSVVGMTLGDVVMKIRSAPRPEVALRISRADMLFTAVVRRMAMKKENDQYRPQ